MVHDLSGTVLPYVPLTQRLTDDVPVYGLGWQAQAHSLADSAPLTLEALAAWHVAAIREVQAHGPYRLAGWLAGRQAAFWPMRLQRS